MSFSHLRLLILTFGILVGAVALACGSGKTDTVPAPTADPGAVTSVTAVDASPAPAAVESPAPTADANTKSVARAQTETEVPSTKPAVEPTPLPYDPNKIMWRVFSGYYYTSEDSLDALKEIVEHKDTSQVPVLAEALYFKFAQAGRAEITATLQELTGQDIGTDAFEWLEWLGKHREEYRPPEEYVDWKINLFFNLDPGFAQFLRPAKMFSRIDVTEIVWGGVRPDGIPDLQFPQNIPSQEADYLELNDRVVGVSINGEHRAYPLRIINAHEMVNDVLGGEPIALSW